MSQEGADVVGLFMMIGAIAMMKEEQEQAKAKQWAEMLPLVKPESAPRTARMQREIFHFALVFKAPLEVFSRLLVAWPDALS